MAQQYLLTSVRLQGTEVLAFWDTAQQILNGKNVIAQGPQAQDKLTEKEDAAKALPANAA